MRLPLYLMTLWTKIFVVTNVIYWALFFYLLSRRRWNAAALLVGLFHMLLASTLSVAPFRSLFDAGYRWQLGFVGFDGRAAAIPAFLTLGWAVAAACIAVGRARGRWMWLVVVGDILFALNLGAAIVLFPLRGNPAYQKIQFGETVILSGWMASLILLFAFVLPPVMSGIWAGRRAR